MLTLRGTRSLLAPALIALAAACLSAPAAAAPPTNDAFSASTQLIGRQATSSGINKDATKEAGEPNHAGNPGGASVWYRWTAPASGQTVVSTCGTNGFDTLLAAYTGDAVNALTPVTHSDDACGVQSLIEFPAVQGTTYRIAIDGINRGTGAATGAFDIELVLRPPNDDFADAAVLAGNLGTTSGLNVGATTENDEPPGVISSVWYRWTAPLSGPATFETCGSGFDTTLHAFAGSQLPALTLLASNDDDDCGVGSRVVFDALAGTTYAIAVGGFAGDEGDISLTWNRNPRRPFVVDFPTVSGIAREDELLTGSNGVWGGGEPMSLSYAWWRCDSNYDACNAIAGAVSQTYRLTAGDVGYHVFLEVTASNVAGASNAFSDETPLVRSRGPTNAAAPGLSGLARVGDYLTGSPGAWLGRVPITHAFQWQACDAAGTTCRNLDGEVGNIIFVEGVHVGQRLRLVVTATNPDGSRSAASALSDVVTRPPSRRQTQVRRCVVPRIKGKTAKVARQAIRRSGCRVGRITRAYSASVRTGRVIAQQPRAGRRLLHGAKVNYILSRGPKR